MFRPVAAILQESGAGILDLVEHCGADIEPLEKAGVPAFSPIQDSRFYFNYHHTAADTLDKIVPKELAENSAVVAVVVVRAGEHGTADASLIGEVADAPIAESFADICWQAERLPTMPSFFADGRRERLIFQISCASNCALR